MTVRFGLTILCSMDWLNYHHLRYFWTVVRTGSIVAASAELRLSVPTISVQLRTLESSLGAKLLVHSGRRVVPTEIGWLVFKYADEIFSTGQELLEMVKGRNTGRSGTLRIGVSDVLPKRIAYRLIQPALSLRPPLRIVCREHRPDRLLAELAVNELDLVLSDGPMRPDTHVRAFNHFLGACDVAFYGIPKLAGSLHKDFPRSLDGAPLLLPTDSMAMRPSLDVWFETQRIRPVIVGEFDDFSLLRVFGEAGMGIVPAPSVLDEEMQCRYGFKSLGRTKSIRATFYAISVERKIKNHAVAAICESARQELFVRMHSRET